MTSPKKRNSSLPTPLDTRHVFLDTQVYRALGHNKANPALKLLKARIDEYRVVLHTTDITLLEVKRQIREQVFARQRELTDIEKDLGRWRKASAKNPPSAPVAFDAEKVANDLFDEFFRFITYDCGAVSHSALSIPAERIFLTYFDRKAPFDGEESKEFPDGFMVAALSDWCIAQKETMYVTTADKAMTRAVKADDNLIELNSLHTVLERAAADLGAAGEAAADQALNGQNFDATFQSALATQIQETSLVYYGDLPDGEAYDGTLGSVEEIHDYSVVALNAKNVTLIASAVIKIGVELQYDDLDSAWYDKEDGRYHGVEIASTDIEDLVTVEVLLEIDRTTGSVRDAKLLNTEIEVTDAD